MSTSKTPVFFERTRFFCNKDAFEAYVFSFIILLLPDIKSGRSFCFTGRGRLGRALCCEGEGGAAALGIVTPWGEDLRAVYSSISWEQGFVL